MDPDPEPEAASSGESARTTDSSARSRTTMYYDFQHPEDEEPYAAELNGNQPHHHRNEDGVFDSGNFSEPLEINGGHPSPSPLSHLPPIPKFSIGSPLLRQCNSSTYQDVLSMSRNFIGPNQVTSSPQLSVPDRSPASTSQPRVSTENVTRSDSYLHDLVGNFNTLYEQKLNEVEKKSITGEGDREYNIVQKQNAVMKEWVRDLNEQNAVLIETVDEMEKEADEKIELLQIKIQRSTQMVMEHMEIIQNYEKQVQELVNQRTESDKEFEMLRSEAMAMDKKRKVLQEKLSALELDHSSLTTLMTRIRDWGLWDITGLTLSPKTHYHLFGLYPNLPGSEVQTVFTQERARQVKETEQRLGVLQLEFENLKKEKDETLQQVRDMDTSISNQQAEKEDLLRQIAKIESEKDEIKRKLEDTQDTLTQTINTANSAPRIDIAAHDAEMAELLKELRSLKQELNVACTERQNAMLEASSLKAEMGQRLLEMTQMKNLLVNIQLETETTRGRVQDVQIKQDQLATLQEQVKMYQEKYEDARAMLNNKADMIQNLQEQMDSLHDKVIKIEQVSTSTTPEPSIRNTQTPSPVPSHIIHPPTLPPRRLPEEKLKALSKKPDALRAAAKNVDTASRAMRELERIREEEVSTPDSNRVSFTGEKLPWNEYFYNSHTNNTYLKELEALTAEATTALNIGKPIYDKNRMSNPTAPAEMRDEKRPNPEAAEESSKNKSALEEQQRSENKTKEKRRLEKSKAIPLSVRYPARSPREIVVTASAVDADSPRTRSRSMDPKKTVEPPRTSRRSHSKNTRPIETKVTKSILRKSDSGNPSTRKTSKPTLRSAQHEKITKYFSDRYGIHIENPKISKSASTPMKSTPQEAPYTKERIKFAPYISSSSKAAPEQQLRKKTSDRRVNFDIPERNAEKEPAKTSRAHNHSGKLDEYRSPDQLKMRLISDQAHIREITSHGDQDQDDEDESSGETVIFPRVGSRPTTREEKLSSLPSGGLGYIPTTDPYELKKLEALVHAAVNTSKQLINSIDPSQGNVRMRVTASHRRHVKTSVKHSEKYKSSDSSPERQYSKSLEFDEDERTSSDLPSVVTPQNDTSSEEEGLSKMDTSPEAIQYLRRRTDELTKPLDTIKSIPKSPPAGLNPSRRQEEILASLPVQKQETVVKNWIIRSGFELSESSYEPNKNEPNVQLHSFEAHQKKTAMRRVSHRSHRPPVTLHQSSYTNSSPGQTALEKYPRAGDVNLQKMSRNVDHWVSTRNNDESSDTDSSFEKVAPKHGQGQGQGDVWCQNNNVASSMSSTPAPVPQEVTNQENKISEELEKLNAKILSLESQCKSKDTLLQSLQCELNLEKDFKKRIQAEMASREAEVTMQKAIQLDLAASMLDNEMSTRLELKEKNILISQCYDLLTKIEPDYLRGDQDMGQGLEGCVPSNPASYEDADIDNLRAMLKGSKMEAVLSAIIDENRDLKEKFGEGNVGQNELGAVKTPRADAMASQLYNLILTLEQENSQLKTELNDMSCSSSLSDRSRSQSETSNVEINYQADIQKRDEVIRLQKQQIANFEEYVQRLHHEIKQWTNVNTNQGVVPDSEDGSIIAHLQENIKQFQEFNKAKTEQHLELMFVMRGMKQELQNSRKREIELKSDNHMLRSTVETLNEKITELVKSFEYLQYQFGSPHLSAWASMDMSDTSDGVQNGLPLGDPGNVYPESMATTPENLEIQDANFLSADGGSRSNGMSTTDLKRPSFPFLDDGGQGDNS